MQLENVEYALASDGHVKDLAGTWTVLADQLRMPDPSARRLALRSLQRLMPILRPSQMSSQLLSTLIRNLVEVYESDEDEVNRCSAVITISLCLFHAGSANKAVLQTGYDLVMSAFASVLLAAHRTSYETVSTLAAVGILIETELAQALDQQQLIDGWLSAQLAPIGIDPFVQAEALTILSNNLRRTPRNRRRVEKFVPLVLDLMQRAQGLHVAVIQALAHWWSVWYARASDDVVRKASLPAVSKGYVQHRLAFLASPTGAILSSTTTPPSNLEETSLLQELNETESAARQAIIRNRLYPDNQAVKFAEHGPFEFDPAQAVRTVTVVNTTNMSQSITLQMHPPQYFSADPGFATIPPFEKLAVSIEFTPQPHAVERSKEIEGFARIRSQFGMPLHRMPLTACNAPLMQVLCSSLDCGWCAVGDTRAVAMAVRNVGRASVSCSVMKTIVDAPFRVFPDHATINAGGLRLFYVMFEPKHEMEYCDQVVVLSTNESAQVKISGRGGVPLAVPDRHIEFGCIPMGQPALRHITVFNNDTKNALPLRVAGCHPAIQVDNVSVEPGQRLELPITVNSSFPGHVRETFVIVTPFARPIDVTVNAFVGPMIIAACASHVRLPPTSAAVPMTVDIPFVNRTDSRLEFMVNVDAGSVFKHGLPPKDSVVPVEYAGKLVYALGPGQMGHLRFTMVSANATGVFHSAVRVTVSKPSYGEYADLFTLHAICMASGQDSQSAQDQSRDAWHNYMRNLPHTTLVKLKALPLRKSEPVFAVEPPELVVKATKPGAPPRCVVTVRNLTETPQRFSMLMTEGFSTEEMEPDGVVPANTTLYVPIVFIAADETARVPLNGLFTLLDNRAVPVSSRLLGVTDVGLEVTLTETTVRLIPRLNVDEVASRVFAINNDACVPIDFRIESKPVGDEGPFVITPTSGTIAPFAHQTVALTFKAAAKGLIRKHVDILCTNVPGGSALVERLHSAEFIGSVGDVDVSIDVAYVDFGPVHIGSNAQRTVSFTNPTHHETTFTLDVHGEAFHLTRTYFRIMGRDTLRTSVTFEPKSDGQFLSFLLVHQLAKTQVITLLGFGGTLQLTSNMGDTRQDPPRPPINLGLVATNAPIRLPLMLRNAGSLAFSIEEITSSTPMLKYELAAQTVDADDLDEVDWDELEAQKIVRLDFGDSALVAPSSLPLFLPHGRELPVRVVFESESTGIQTASLALQLKDQGSEQMSTVFFDFTVNVQPMIHASPLRVKFGVIPARTMRSEVLTLTNISMIPLDWQLDALPAMGVAVDGGIPAEGIEGGEPLEKNPFELVPSIGRIVPGGAIVVSIAFTPRTPQQFVSSSVILTAVGLGTRRIELSGAGGTAQLQLDTTTLDFGCIRLGVNVGQKFELRNVGLLDAKYQIKVNNDVFRLSPSTGTIPSRGAISVSVRFAPTDEEDVVGEAVIKLLNSTGTEDLLVDFRGKGGHAKLVCTETTVAFGRALMNHQNITNITIVNEGTAEGSGSLECPFANVSFDPAQFAVPAGGKTIVSILYRPTRVENLNTYFTLLQTDTSVKKQQIKLLATVGVPSLVVDPTMDCDFGVAMLKQHHTHSFTVKNGGNVDLDFELVLARPVRLQELEDRPADAPPLIDVAGTKMEPVELAEFMITPTRGILRLDEPVQFSVTFAPAVFRRESSCQLVLKNNFQNMSGELRGVGGTPVFDMVVPSHVIDFGLCRMAKGAQFHREILVKNTGNLPMRVWALPEPDDGDMAAVANEMSFSLETLKSRSNSEGSIRMKTMGFFISNYAAVVQPNEQHVIKVRYVPLHTNAVQFKLRVSHDLSYESVFIKGRGGVARLIMCDVTGKQILAPYAMGILPVNKHHPLTLLLKNDGSFPEEFFITPQRPVEFELFPTSGVVAPGQALPLQIIFSPKEPREILYDVRVIWEGEPLVVNLSGTGGIGRLETGFFHDKDVSFNGMDFDLVTVNVPATRQMIFRNAGTVPVNVDLRSNAPKSNVLLAFDREQQDAYEDKRARMMAGAVVQALAKPQEHVEPLTFVPTLQTTLLAGKLITVTVSMTIEHQEPFTAILMAECEFNKIHVPMKARGGRVDLVAETDSSLHFGDIATDHTYTRNMHVRNDGTVPTHVQCYWLVPGLTESTGRHATIRLAGYDPEYRGTLQDRRALAQQRWGMLRSLIRGTTQRVRPQTTVELATASSRAFHAMHAAASTLTTIGTNMASKIKLLADKSMRYDPTSLSDLSASMLHKKQTVPVLMDAPAATAFPSLRKRLLETRTSIEITPVPAEDGSLAAIADMATPATDSRPQTANSEREPRTADSEVQQTEVVSDTKDLFFAVPPPTPPVRMPAVQTPTLPVLPVPRPPDDEPSGAAAVRQRGRRKTSLLTSATVREDLRQLFDSIRASDIEASHIPTGLPHISVSPIQATIAPGQIITVTASIHLHHTNPFNAVLVCRPHVPGAALLELPLSARAKKVSVVVDDTSTLNFGRQPLGSSEVLIRTFTNVGDFDVAFKWKNDNLGLTINPREGFLRRGKSKKVIFSFRPMNDFVQVSPVDMEFDCASPLRLNIYGAGGVARMVLDQQQRIDFGRCMISKNTMKFLRVSNTGTAVLRVTFELEETSAFFKGPEWPEQRIVIKPNNTYRLPLSFMPPVENPKPGTLIIKTDFETHKLELLGSGREAVLQFNKASLFFHDCLVGNTYYDTLQIANSGDINYPVKFETENQFSDVTFLPEAVTLRPFQSLKLSIIYRPSAATDLGMNLVVSSTYSNSEIPLSFQAGVASVELSTSSIDFGLFDVSTREHRQRFTVHNPGTLPLRFAFLQTGDMLFSFSRERGVISPGETLDVVVHYSHKETQKFEKDVMIRTDLEHTPYSLHLVGHAARAGVDPMEIRTVDFGPCPVRQVAVQTISITNIGDYFLDFVMKFDYPLICEPSSGRVNPGDVVTFTLSWQPSGSHRLHNIVKFTTNIGVFDIHVVGSALFPQLTVSRPRIPFGMCAVGFRYRRSFKITNVGQVPAHWTLSAAPMHFWISAQQGVLQPGRNTTVDVSFTPQRTGLIRAVLRIQTHGRFKEVVLMGQGGNVSLAVVPQVVDAGACGCMQWLRRVVTVHNTGDVGLSLTLKTPPTFNLQQNTVEIPAGLATQVQLTFMIEHPGPFDTTVTLHSREVTQLFTLRGVGEAITVTPMLRALLSMERLPTLNPLESVEEFDTDPPTRTTAVAAASERLALEQMTAAAADAAPSEAHDVVLDAATTTTPVDSASPTPLMLVAAAPTTVETSAEEQVSNVLEAMLLAVAQTRVDKDSTELVLVREYEQCLQAVENASHVLLPTMNIPRVQDTDSTIHEVLSIQEMVNDPIVELLLQGFYPWPDADQGIGKILDPPPPFRVAT